MAMIRKNRGFTLVELLVVIAIIGILSSIVLASLNSVRQKSRDARRISDIKQLQLALELYFDSCTQYPEGDALAITIDNGCPGTTSLGSFISTIAADPSTGAVYAYAGLNTDCTSYHLGATLEDAGHSALPGANQAANGAAAANCLALAGDFDGTVATTYDVIP